MAGQKGKVLDYSGMWRTVVQARSSPFLPADGVLALFTDPIRGYDSVIVTLLFARFRRELDQ
ncbi:hypothetical protein BURK2_00803 [Burkholderiales bacterium]|nr:hypothetical protein BURK2_00803 [Burkholderiales bacterium]